MIIHTYIHILYIYILYISIAWVPKGKSTWFDCLRVKGVRQLHAVARSPTTHKRLRLFESPVLIIHLEVTEGSWADPYLLETWISFGGRTSSFSRAALILPGSACNRQKNSLRQGSGLCRLPARVKHLKTRTSLDWFKKKLGETIVSYHEIGVCLVFLPVNVEAKIFWKAVSRWHLPPRSWPFQWPALRLMWSGTKPMAMKNPSFSSVSSQLSQLAMFDCQRVPILSAASLCVEFLFEPPGTSWTPNSARRSSDFKRSSRSSSQRKRRCSNEEIPRCSHQNSWYLWMFIPFKKKMMGNLFRYFLDPNMDLGEGTEPLGLSSLGTIWSLAGFKIFHPWNTPWNHLKLWHNTTYPHQVFQVFQVLVLLILMLLRLLPEVGPWATDHHHISAVFRERRGPNSSCWLRTSRSAAFGGHVDPK